jgi:hypothetical protein
MRVLIVLLKGFGYVWLIAAGFLILAGIAGTWTAGGFSAVQDVLNPFNVSNYVVTIITLAPGIGALVLARKIETRDEGTTRKSIDTQVENTVRQSSLVSKSTFFDEEISLDEAQDIVNRYGAVLENTKSQFRDEAVVPAKKQRIKDSLVIMARNSKEAGSSNEIIGHLRFGYSSLAYFVSARDENLASVYDDIAAGSGKFDDRDLLQIAAKFAVPGGGAQDVSRDAYKEFERLLAEFDKRIQR